MTNQSRKSHAMQDIKSSINMQQFIAKLSEPQRRRKSSYKMYVYNQIARTGKAVCTGKGVVLPVKLDISKLNLKKLGECND